MKIERELLVVKNGVGFTKAFFAKGAQYFADYYLWSSVFTRPPYSIFTRVQRLTCCLCISMGFMCVNTLWYQTLDKEESELGVIDVSGEAVLVGIVTALVAIPINFPLIMLFRRSKPWRMPGEIGELFKHIKSNNKQQSDPDEQTAAQLYNLQRWAREKWKHRHKSSIFKHLSENESSRSSIDAHSYSSGFGELSSEDRFRAMFTDSDLTSPELTESWESLDTDPIPSMYHKKLKSPKIWLPHVFYFIAWGGSILIVIASSVITIVLGLKFSYAQAIYWMQSMYFSFLQCIFITQPSVMAMLTIGKAWKHSNNIKIFDHYDDNTDLIDKRLLHRSRVQLYEQDLSKAIAARQRSRYLRFARPPQPKELQKAKEKMLKEKHMYAILTDVILFLILIFCVLWMAYGKETSLHGPLNKSVNQIFLKTKHPFTNVTTVDDLWNWLQEDMVDTLYWQRWYNGDPIAEDAGSVMITGESILLGRPSLRQLRVRPQTCTVPPVMRPIIGDCLGGYTKNTLSRDPYGPEDKWVFRTAHQLLRYCKWGMFTTYEGDGYAVDFNNTRDDAESLLWHLRNNSWIDAQTRAVILEFTLYNAPYNLFSAVAFVAEIPGSGAVYPMPKIESVQLYRYEKPYDYFIMACELLFVLLVALISKQEIVKVVKQKRAYFRSAWSWVEMSLILVSITYFAMYVYRFAYVSEAGRRLKATYLEEFVDLSFLAWWDQRLRDLIGLILFITTLKFLHLLRFNRMFAMFGAIFEAALGHLLLHMLCYTILETAFACLGNLLFGSHYYPFRNVYPAYEVISSLIVGSAPDHSKLWFLFPVLWPMFYISYVICMVVFMAGLMKAILCHNYRKVKHCPLETVSGQEVISFFWHRFLCWLGIREEKVDDSDRDKLPMEFTMAEIQYQVDELVFRMNAILHQNGLPDKPIDYLDDSDATQNYHDDGISSYPSEDQEFDNDKFEERVQRLEEQLYFNNPELRELMTSPEDDEPDRHKGLRARLELEIFRQLQLSRQQDGLESDEPGLNGLDRDSGQLTASGSLASYDIGEDSALSCTDLNEVGAGRPATAYRKDDGQVAFPQPMKNLGTLEEISAHRVQRKTSAVKAWTDDVTVQKIGEPCEEECSAESAPTKTQSKKNLLKRLPRPHTAAVFPIRDAARLSEDGEGIQRPARGRIQHKDSNTSNASSSSAYSRRQSSDGMGGYGGSESSHTDSGSRESRRSSGVDAIQRRGRNWKVTPFTKHGWEGEDLGESQSSERSGCSSSHAVNEKQVSPPAPSRTNSHDSQASHQNGSSRNYSSATGGGGGGGKHRKKGGVGRPSIDELVSDLPIDSDPKDHYPIGHHPNLTVSMESFPLPNSLEHLVVSDSTDNEKQSLHPASSRSHKRRKGHEGGKPQSSRLRKTKSRGKGKGRNRLQDVGHVNEGYSSDSHGEGFDDDDHIPVIEMSKHSLPGHY